MRASASSAPLRNRVTPFGDIVATPERGTMYGNRGGRFHDPATRRLIGRRRFASRRWICCELSFRGRHREVFGPGFTGLFFLDEATALAAGHRPCFECRRVDALRFRDCFARGNKLARAPGADEMDVVLHAERLAAKPVLENWRDLPAGAMVAAGGEPHLVAAGMLLRWTHGGYRPAGPATPLALLTPPSIVAALGAGFAPRLHPSARAFSDRMQLSDR